jgi:hypothetical protein
MRNISDKLVYKIETRVLYSTTFFLNSAVHEICGKIFVQPSRLRMTVWRICIASSIIKATNTYEDYVICIVFPLQKMVALMR